MEELGNFEELKKENEKMREELNKLIGFGHKRIYKSWIKINELIENEIQQERLCGQ